jgi:hypothetical protein
MPFLHIGRRPHDAARNDAACIKDFANGYDDIKRRSHGEPAAQSLGAGPKVVLMKWPMRRRICAAAAPLLGIGYFAERHGVVAHGLK